MYRTLRFASRSSTSPWQGFGAHQQSKFFAAQFLYEVTPETPAPVELVHRARLRERNKSRRPFSAILDRL